MNEDDAESKASKRATKQRRDLASDERMVVELALHHVPTPLSIHSQPLPRGPVSPDRVAAHHSMRTAKDRTWLSRPPMTRQNPAGGYLAHWLITVISLSH